MVQSAAPVILAQQNTRGDDSRMSPAHLAGFEVMRTPNVQRPPKSEPEKAVFALPVGISAMEKKCDTANLPTVVKPRAENVFSAPTTENLQVTQFSAAPHEKIVADQGFERRLQEMEARIQKLQIGPSQPILAAATPQVVEGEAQTIQIAALGTGGKLDNTPCQQLFPPTSTL